MATFKTLKQVEDAILRDSKKAITAAQTKVFNSFHKYMCFYYAEYEPGDYERTWQLFHTLVKSGIKTSRSGAKGVSAEVYFDSSALNYKDIGSPDKWSSKSIIDTALMEGTHGLKNIKGTAVWECGMDEIGDVKNLLLMSLKEAGIPIK